MLRAIPTVCLLLGCLPGCRAGATALEELPAAASIEGKFSVRAPGERTAAALYEWMHAVAARLERRIGTEARFMSGETLLLLLDASDPDAPAGVTFREEWQGGRLRQTLRVQRLEDLDQEDMLEAFCRLWLHRVLLAYVPAGQQGPPISRLPVWVTTGLAQTLFPEQLARNRLVLEDALASPAFNPAVETILNLPELPPGRGARKSLTGLFWEWMSLRAGTQGLPLLLRSLAAGRFPNEKDLAGILGFDTPAALSRDWEVWLFSRRQLIGDQRFRPGTLRLPVLHDLERVPSEALSLASSSVIEEDWSIADLLEQRDEPWMPLFCQSMSWDLQVLSLGQPPEVAEVIAHYAELYQALGRNPPLRPAARHREQQALRRQWHAARDARDRLLELDRSDARMSSPTNVPAR